jgi:hypothetical protein
LFEAPLSCDAHHKTDRAGRPKHIVITSQPDGNTTRVRFQTAQIVRGSMASEPVHQHVLGTPWTDTQIETRSRTIREPGTRCGRRHLAALRTRSSQK